MVCGRSGAQALRAGRRQPGLSPRCGAGHPCGPGHPRAPRELAADGAFRDRCSSAVARQDSGRTGLRRCRWSLPHGPCSPAGAAIGAGGILMAPRLRRAATVCCAGPVPRGSASRPPATCAESGRWASGTGSVASGGIAGVTSALDRVSVAPPFRSGRRRCTGGRAPRPPPSSRPRRPRSPRAAPPRRPRAPTVRRPPGPVGSRHVRAVLGLARPGTGEASHARPPPGPSALPDRRAAPRLARWRGARQRGYADTRIRVNNDG